MSDTLIRVRQILDARTAGDRGATAVEYGLLVALIAMVMIGAVIAFGGDLTNLFTSVGNTVNHAKS